MNFSAAIGDAGRSTDKLTEEVRLASSGSGTIEWLLGGFYTHEKSDNLQHIGLYDLSGAVSPLNLATASLPSVYEEIAGFGNVTVHLSSKFDVTGGLRYAHNNQDFTQNGSGLLIGSVPTAKSSEGVVTYLANARYRFSQNVTAYARFATGYRPGGPNFVVRDPVSGVLLAPLTFQADTLKSYELGLKGVTADHSFGIDLAAYHIDWNNMQVAAAANGVSVIDNAGSATVDGAELTLTAHPAPSFTVTGAFAYQDAHLTANAPALGGIKGEPLPNVPKFTAAISADYRAQGGGIRPTAGATLRFVSDRKSGFDGSASQPQYNLPDYATVDLRVGATIGPVDAQIFVRNLLDDRGQLSAVTTLAILGGPAQVAVQQPRTIGLSLTSRF
jgi:outer membrane receptor protein involved in Fe transport